MTSRTHPANSPTGRGPRCGANSRRNQVHPLFTAFIHFFTPSLPHRLLFTAQCSPPLFTSSLLLRSVHCSLPTAFFTFHRFRVPNHREPKFPPFRGVIA